MNSALEKALEVVRARKLAGIKTEHRNPIEKAAARPTSLRLAITAKCYDCAGQDADPGVRRRVGQCNCPKCPLWPVRPWQSSDEESD